jgi:hypothetical protein
MNLFNYAADAELFVAGSTLAAKKPLRYIPFVLASEAIRFAIEQLAPSQRGAICLEVNEERFDNAGIRRLYESAAYPLPRSRAREGDRARPEKNRKTLSAARDPATAEERPPISVSCVRAKTPMESVYSSGNKAD